MSVGLYVDENVRVEITLGLRDRGIDVISVGEDSFTSAPDPVVMDRANVLGRVVFTHDMDFLIEAAARQRARRTFTGVIYAHPLKMTIGECISDLELISSLSHPDELRDRVIRLPL